MSADPNKAKASLTWAQVALSSLGVFKEVMITIMAFLVQYERIKGKKTEDQLELMKADRRADTAKKDIQDKADSVDARRGIDDFLQR
jgi:hypothetical protein